IEGITLLRNPVNLGFGPAVNQAALHARAKYLLLLNTDALVRPGWLPPLRAILDAEPDVAAVAPRLLHLDGTVQEAGSIVAGGASSDRRRLAGLLERNRPLFVERWRPLLASRPPSPVHWEPEDVLPGRDLRCADRVLVVGDFVPDARLQRPRALLHSLVEMW